MPWQIGQGLVKRFALQPPPSHQPWYLFLLPDQSCFMIQSMESRSLNVFRPYCIHWNFKCLCVCMCVCVCLCFCVFVCVCVWRENRSHSKNDHKLDHFFKISCNKYNSCTKWFHTPGKVVFHIAVIHYFLVTFRPLRAA